MTFLDRTCIALILLSSFTVNVKAQNAAIGYWDSHLPYNSAIGVATDGGTVYTACGQAFFTYGINDTKPVTYSKVDGMSDVGMQCISYDMPTNTVVLVYANGNIDLYKDNTFYNIPDLKLITTPELKKIYQ